MAISTSATIAISELAHRYGSRVSLQDVTVSFGPGVTGILGPNGAGKSTLMSIIATLLKPTSGTVWVLGRDISLSDERHAVRREIGVLPQSLRLAPGVRVLDTVAYSGWTHGLSKDECYYQARWAIEQVGLSGAYFKRRVGRLSGGEQQRVAIAATIVHEPSVLIVDEPTVGLDPQIRMEFRQLLRSLGESTTVLMSTHLVEDVQFTSKNLIVLNAGKVIYCGPTSGLQAVGGSEEQLGSALEVGYQQLLRTVI